VIRIGGKTHAAYQAAEQGLLRRFRVSRKSHVGDTLIVESALQRRPGARARDRNWREPESDPILLVVSCCNGNCCAKPQQCLRMDFDLTAGRDSVASDPEIAACGYFDCGAVLRRLKRK
jgi:hypothetical protein